MLITRSISEPIRTGLKTEELWHAEDKGLIKCWETGRELAAKGSPLATQAAAGELPKLNFRGGLDRPLKVRKYGTLQYLAQWQGLRQEDLIVDTQREPALICSKHGTTVIFTADIDKIGDE